mgnify:CR=1 FL=1
MPAAAQTTIKVGEINSYSGQPGFTEPYKKAWELALGEINADPESVRATSMEALLSRFQGVDAAYGERRAELAVTLFVRLARDQGKRGRLFASALGYSARVLDIGRSVDFFDRHEHAARIVLASELDGFSQVEVARIAAVFTSM